MAAFVIASTSVVGAVATPRVDAIYQGVNSSASWAAFVQSNDENSTCTGTFVTPQTVPTAARCVVLFEWIFDWPTRTLKRVPTDTKARG